MSEASKTSVKEIEELTKLLPIVAEGSLPSDGFNCFWLKDANGRTFGDVYGPQSSPDQQSIAILVVEAVNNHARLTAELEVARKALESVQHYIRQDVNDVGLEMLSQEYANLWHEVNAVLQGQQK